MLAEQAIWAAATVTFLTYEPPEPEFYPASDQLIWQSLNANK